jgi:hypothetical protein
VTWLTRIGPCASIITASRMPVRCASSSVWPSKVMSGHVQRFLRQWSRHDGVGIVGLNHFGGAGLTAR